MEPITTRIKAAALRNPAGAPPGAGLPRRVALALLLAGVAAEANAAEGRATIPDLAISCDRTLRTALRAVARQFAAREPAPVHLFSAPPTLMVAQIERQTQTDLLITTTAALDEGARRGVIKPGSRVGAWRNGLVIAGRRGDATGPEIAAQLGQGRFAVTDPTIEEVFDGPAVLARLGLTDALGPHLIGAANTAEVAFLVRTGAARLGLMQRTDVLADPSLAVAMAVPDEIWPPTLYAAALAATAASPNAQPFLEFLGSEQARSQLRSFGLETVA